MEEKFIWNKYIDDNGNEQIEKIDENGAKFYVPNDPTNSDFKAYLKSLEK